MNKACWFAILAVFVFGPGLAHGETLDEELSALKADLAELNTALTALEEEILYPENTQLAVFLSVEGEEYFQLNSVELAVDDRPTSSYLYSEQEREALAQGGIQRLYLGNLTPGEHQITATFNAKGTDGRHYSKTEIFSISKEEDAERVELVVRAQAPSQDPQLSLKRWQ